MNFHKNKEKILIIDFGSQLTKLIARRIRDEGVYSEVLTPTQIFKFNEFDKIKGLFYLAALPQLQKKFESIPKKYLIKKYQF